MSAAPLDSLGLGGDGDEVDAIETVEHRFGVTLDVNDAPNWRTVGNVFAALQRALPESERGNPLVWTRFAEAISAETGVDPVRVTPETRLLC